MPRTYTKKTVAKKAPAKKTTTTTRRGGRKALPKETPIEQPTAEDFSEVAGDALTEGSDKASNQGFENMLDGLMNKPLTMAETLQNIEFIDLRGVSFFGRFQVATLLQNVGYNLADHLATPITEASGVIALAASLHLNHHNKLVTPQTWDVAKHSRAISKVEAAFADPSVFFSGPVPETLEVNGELFQRVK